MINNNKLKFIVDNIMFVGIFIEGILTILLNLLKQNKVSSVFFKASFALMAVWFLVSFTLLIICLIKKSKKISFKKVLTSFEIGKEFKLFIWLFAFALISFVSILASAKFKVGSLSFFKQFICVVACLSLFYLIINAKVSRKIIDICLIVHLVFCIVVVFLFYSGVIRTWHNKTPWVDLNLNFENPNPAGEFCMMSSIILIGTILYSKYNIVKIFSAATAPFILFLCRLTSSRNPYVAIIFAVLLIAIICLRKKASRTTIFLTIITPIIYVSMIMLLGIAADRFESLKPILEQYGIYGRYYLWAKYFYEYSQHWLFGSYYLIGSGSNILSFVNSYIMILISFGPLAYVVFLFFNYKLAFKIAEPINANKFSMKNCYPLFCFLTILFLGFNEGGVYVGAGGLHVLGIFCAVMFYKASVIEENVNEKSLLMLYEEIIQNRVKTKNVNNNFQYLLTTVKKSPKQIIELVKQSKICGNILVGNQLMPSIRKYKLKVDGCNVTVYNQKSSGVSLNRNFLLKKAKAKYITFIDDDIYCCDNQSEIEEVVNIVNQNCVKYNVVSDNKIRRSKIIKNIGYTTFNKFLHNAGQGYFFNRQFLIDNKIFYREEVGPGSTYNHGEDTIYIKDFSKLSDIFVIPITVLHARQDKSTWHGDNRDYKSELIAHGYVYRYLFGKAANLRSIAFLITHMNHFPKTINYFKLRKYMKIGINKAKEAGI